MEVAFSCDTMFRNTAPRPAPIATPAPQPVLLVPEMGNDTAPRQGEHRQPELIELADDRYDNIACTD